MKIFVSMALLTVAMSLSGCISLSSVGHSGTRLVDMSHKVDSLISASTLPDGNIVCFVKGRLAEGKGEAEFSLLVSKEALRKMKASRLKNRSVATGRDVVHDYEAMIGPPSAFKRSDWASIKIVRDRCQDVFDAKADELMPATDVPIIYVLPRAPGASNESGLRKLWGDVHIVYVESLPDGTAFRCTIMAKAERIEKSHNGLAWLPATIPLDVATLPAQAIWGALFVIISAGEAAGAS